MRVSPINKNTVETWESYFQADWEKNAGRRQTALFARYFLDTVRLPPEAKTLLDVGCGMGDALPEIHARYPHLKLKGCDVSANALEKARQSYGGIADFEEWGFDDIEGHYDVIYCSNTLEHFENHVDIAAGLLAHCRWLYILVPYMELKDGKRLTVDPGEWHVATFDERTFDPLLKRAAATKVRHWLHPCPIAWGPPPAPLWKRAARKVKNTLLGRPPRAEIFFEVTSSGRGNTNGHGNG